MGGTPSLPTQGPPARGRQPRSLRRNRWCATSGARAVVVAVGTCGSGPAHPLDTKTALGRTRSLYAARARRSLLAATKLSAPEAAGIRTPARIYDLRSTFASDALAAGVSVFELARIMGTSLRMIERYYGALPDGAGAGIAERLDALDTSRMRPTDVTAEDV